MALKGANPFTSYIRMASGISPPAAFTMSFLYQNSATPSTGTGFDQEVLSLADSTRAYNATFCWHNTATPKTFFFEEAGTTYRLATIVTALSANTTYNIILRYDGVNITVYLDGVLEATTAAAIPTILVNPKLAALSAAAGTIPLDDGIISEVGLWAGTALAQADITALGARVSPALVFPSGLTAYWPLIRNIVDLRGNVLQESGDLTVQTHPRVYYPCSPGLRTGTTAPDKPTLSTTLSIGMNAAPASSEMVALSMNANAAATLVTVNPGVVDLSLRSRIKLNVVIPYIATGRAKDVEGR